MYKLGQVDIVIAARLADSALRFFLLQSTHARARTYFPPVSERCGEEKGRMQCLPRHISSIEVSAAYRSYNELWSGTPLVKMIAIPPGWPVERFSHVFDQLFFLPSSFCVASMIKSCGASVLTVTR